MHTLEKPNQLNIVGNPIESPLDPHTVVLKTQGELHFLDVASIGFVDLGVINFGFL